MMRILKRLKEPSSWAGMGVLVALFKPELAGVWPELVNAGATFAASVMGAVAILAREPGSTD